MMKEFPESVQDINRSKQVISEKSKKSSMVLNDKGIFRICLGYRLIKIEYPENILKIQQT